MDEFLQKIVEKSISELNEFYGIELKNPPEIIVVPDRKTIDILWNKKTESWLIGWTKNDKNIYILDRNNFEKESNHTYHPDSYARLIKHELSHIYFSQLAGGRHSKPRWFAEGVAIYTSGQNIEKTKPTEFKDFLEFTETGGSGVYKESGFAVELLVERFGKDKLLELIKGLNVIASSEAFDELFERICRFNPTYEEFNKLLKS
jgi:hypothetical protein